MNEFCRFAGAEVHTVAAVVGGIVSEEAIKMLTMQFVPIQGTLIYNAVKSTMSVVPM